MKFIAALVTSLLLIFLTSCSSSNENSLPPSEATSQSETPQTSSSQESEEISSGEGNESTEDVESEKVTSGSKAKPSRKSADESEGQNSAPEIQPGSYLTLLEFERFQERYVNSDVVLFFNANWCSTCKIARDNIESSLDSIPSNLVIVVVDFEQETELRKKYGVTIQHTFVQVDGSGNLLAKWSGSVTAEQIAEKTV